MSQDDLNTRLQALGEQLREEQRQQDEATHNEREERLGRAAAATRNSLFDLYESVDLSKVDSVDRAVGLFDQCTALLGGRSAGATTTQPQPAPAPVSDQVIDLRSLSPNAREVIELVLANDGGFNNKKVRVLTQVIQSESGRFHVKESGEVVDGNFRGPRRDAGNGSGSQPAPTPQPEPAKKATPGPAKKATAKKTTPTGSSTDQQPAPAGDSQSAPAAPTPQPEPSAPAEPAPAPAEAAAESTATPAPDQEQGGQKKLGGFGALIKDKTEQVLGKPADSQPNAS